MQSVNALTLLGERVREGGIEGEDIHILSILRRRILTDSTNIVPFNLLLFRSPESPESQHCLHLRFHIIFRCSLTNFHTSHFSILRRWRGLQGGFVIGGSCATTFRAWITGGGFYISTSPGSFLVLAFSGAAARAISAFALPFPGLGAACTTVGGVAITGFRAVSAGFVVASASPVSPAFVGASGAGTGVLAVSIASFRESWPFPLRGSVVVSASLTWWGSAAAMFYVRDLLGKSTSQEGNRRRTSVAASAAVVLRVLALSPSVSLPVILTIIPALGAS